MEKILIINDDKSGSKAYEKLLTRAGYSVITAFDGKSGLKAFDEEEPDLILMDIIMPGLTGFETAGKIRENKDKNHIPIIFISAYQNDLESKIKGLGMGGNEYISEPYEADELKLKIKTLLRGKNYYEELLETKNKLEKSERKFRRILESIEEGYFEVDLKGNMQFVNNSMCRIFGYTREELLVMNNRDFSTHESAKIIFKVFSEIHDTGKPSKIVDYEIIKKDGSRIILELSVGLIKDQNLKPAGFHGVVRDVTENRDIKDELLKKNFAIETSINGIAISDIEGQISYVNKSFINMWKFNSSNEIIGKNITEFWQASDIEIVIMDELKELGFWFGEFEVTGKAGSSFNVLLSAAMIKDKNNKPDGIVSTFVDISMRKNAEKALKKNEAKLNERNKIMERDLKIAQIAQNEIINREIPDLNFLNIDYRFNPMEKVGGDYFSFFPYDDGSIGAFICDVSGHSVASALFLTLIKSVSDKISGKYGKKPGMYMSRLNKELVGNMQSYYLTGIYGFFRYEKNSKEITFTFSSGGHPEPVLVKKNNDIVILKNNSIVVGITEDVDFKEKSVKMDIGDRLYLFTDGIPETANIKKEIIGEDNNFINMFENTSNLSLTENLDNIIEGVNRFRDGGDVNDDILLIGFEIVQDPDASCSI